MVVGVARIVIHIPTSRSLKDKRQVIKSLIAQVQRQFQVSVAEVDEQDRWQIGVLAVAVLSTDAAHADEMLARALRFLQGRLHEAELLDYQTEIVHPF